MHLTRLRLQNFRNFAALDVVPHPHFNLIYGDNGSGKSSILEAIYFLGLGRSFRTHLINRIIQYDTPSLTIFGALKSFDCSSVNIGIEKDRAGKLRLKIGNENTNSIAQLAKLLPLQILNPDGYSLLTEGPRPRREFLDWGVFHVEPLFLNIWQRFQKALEQRNSALQQNISLREIQAWDNELLPMAIELTRARMNYFQQLEPFIQQVLVKLLALENFTIQYYQGWDNDTTLAEVLKSSYFRDKALGYTQYGPQRADIIFKIKNIPVQDILSRGEQKILVCALRLAQGMHLQERTGKVCIYLIDDLAAELDCNHRAEMIEVLDSLKAQVFITSVDTKVISSLLKKIPHNAFHVEHNQVKVRTTI